MSILGVCHELLDAYRSGDLGDTTMPEDAAPEFGHDQAEERLVFFTLPMALNYQRDSYVLWRAARETWEDEAAKSVFDLRAVCSIAPEDLREKLTKHKLALQPNKHIATWQTLAQTIEGNWGSLSGMLESADRDYLKLKEIIQGSHKRQFPYLSGPKIFNYWSFIILTYGGAKLSHREDIEIAPDTHVTKCSVLLGVITPKEAETLSREQISRRWWEALVGTGICPIDMHPPLWFWSRNGFKYWPSDLGGQR